MQISFSIFLLLQHDYLFYSSFYCYFHLFYLEILQHKYFFNLHSRVLFSFQNKLKWTRLLPAMLFHRINKRHFSSTLRKARLSTTLTFLCLPSTQYHWLYPFWNLSLLFRQPSLLNEFQQRSQNHRLNI